MTATPFESAERRRGDDRDRQIQQRRRCGTTDGYNDHKRQGTALCMECRAAMSGYTTAWRRRKKLRARPAKHGTERGLITHWAWDENPCELCQAWQRGYLRSLSLEGLR